MARFLLVALAALGLAGAGLAAPGGAARPGCAEAAGAHRVALVVEHSSGATIRVCVAFDAAAIKGADVLNLSGVEFRTYNYGGGLGSAVCQIDNEPATYPPGCWTSSSPYWAMYVSRQGGPWAVSSLGISSQSFADGDALGFHYIPQSGGGPPPSPAGTCAAPPTPPPSAPPTPAAAATPAETTTASPPSSAATPEPTPSPAPSAAASAAPARVRPATPAGRAAPSAPSVSAGAVAAAGGGGALLGLLLLQLVAPRIRR